MTCVQNGLSQFLTDLGVGPFEKGFTVLYLNSVRNTYAENRPDTSDLITKIEAKGFLDSVENDAEKIVFAMGLISITLIIASIAFCIVFLVSIFVLREPMYSVTALTVYLIFVLFLYYFSRYLFTGAGRALVVPSVEEEIQAYFSAQEKALNAALCTSP